MDLPMVSQQPDIPLRCRQRGDAAMVSFKLMAALLSLEADNVDEKIVEMLYIYRVMAVGFNGD